MKSLALCNLNLLQLSRKLLDAQINVKHEIREAHRISGASHVKVVDTLTLFVSIKILV